MTQATLPRSRVRTAKNDSTSLGAEIAIPYSTPPRHLPRADHPTPPPPQPRPTPVRTHRPPRAPPRTLDPGAVSLIVRRHITAALNEPADGYSAYSLRRGFATEARARGIPDHLIAAHLRDRDLRMVHRYAAPEQHFTNPALGWSGW